MREYILRRALLIVPTILGVSLLISALLELLPGNVADIILAESGGFNTGLTKEGIEADLGLDKNFFFRWVEWLAAVVQGDFGEYFRGGRSVGDVLLQRAPVTLQLSAMALVLSLIIALPIGIISAIRQDSALDYTSRSTAIFMLAVPSFWLATMFFVLAGRWAGWLIPPVEYQHIWENPAENLKQMWAPTVILAFALAGAIM
ncbi:MAG: ABC transporter permease, partial [Dehalococcoidia bacterium]